jgi:hypothetical protein
LPSIATTNIATLHHRPPQGGCPAGPGIGCPSAGRPNAGRPNADRPSADRPSGTQSGFIIEQPAHCALAPRAGLSHPPDICCVHDAPTCCVTHCLHLFGLPPDCFACTTAFNQIKDDGDAPFTHPCIAAIDVEDPNLPGEALWSTHSRNSSSPSGPAIFCRHDGA